MSIIALLLASYGLCFGFIHKAKFLRRVTFINSMFECVYCTGFHTGWMTYLISMTGMPPITFDWSELIFSAFASAAFCYIIDTVVIYLEERTAQVKNGGSGNHPNLFG